MTISNGQPAAATDFVGTSAGAGDSGKVPKLDSTGKLDRTFIKADFGGTGADGALSISSGTTTINLGGLAVVEKNYSSISITGTGQVLFSNPHANGTTIIIKCSGAITVTSSASPAFDARGMGALGGTPGGTDSSSGANDSGATSPGTVGNVGFSMGLLAAGVGASFAGTVGTAPALSYPLGSGVLTSFNSSFYKLFLMVMGCGGTAGSYHRSATLGGSASGTGSVGTNGGPILYIECAGAWNVTSTSAFHAGSLASSNATAAQTGSCSSSAASGSTGSGGTFLAIVNSITANTGGISVAAATPGSGQTAFGTAIQGPGGPGGATGAGHPGTNPDGGKGADGISYGVILSQDIV